MAVVQRVEGEHAPFGRGIPLEQPEAETLLELPGVLRDGTAEHPLHLVVSIFGALRLGEQDVDDPTEKREERGADAVHLVPETRGAESGAEAHGRADEKAGEHDVERGLGVVQRVGAVQDVVGGHASRRTELPRAPLKAGRSRPLLLSVFGADPRARDGEPL